MLLANVKGFSHHATKSTSPISKTLQGLVAGEHVPFDCGDITRSHIRSSSLYQYSSITPRLSGQTSIFGGVLVFVPNSLLGIDGQKKLNKFATVS